MTKIFETFKLPCGVNLNNRIAKAAMTEGLADQHDNPRDTLFELYHRWSNSDAGLLITGNVMIDRRFLERPGNIVIDSKTDYDALSDWAIAGTHNGNHLWMQLNHPGRQCTKLVTKTPLAPSEVPLKLGGLFGRPRAMSEDEIYGAIQAWVFAARTAINAGFTGVQIHAAHGYLISQFLSPKTNLREDGWGGNLNKRARFLFAVYDAIRAELGPSIPISVKLNSADFSKGGFSEEDAIQVASWLEERGIDLLELSGGTYEKIAFFGDADLRRDSTKKREAYFLKYAEQIRKAAPKIPLMLTGGFRSKSGMEDALESGAVDVLGLARPFCIHPNFPRDLRLGHLNILPSPEKNIVFGKGFFGPTSSSKIMRGFNSQTHSAWFFNQIYLLAEGLDPDLHYPYKRALKEHFFRERALAKARR